MGFSTSRWMRKVFMRVLPLAGAALLVGAGAGASGADAGAKATPRASRRSDRKLPEPAYLPELARHVLHQKMRDHAADMTDLLMSTVLLQREGSVQAAQRIANEPRLVRPMPGGEDDLNAMLPERYFVLQDQLRVRAQDLAQAARVGKPLAEPLAGLVETCTTCHAIYLETRPRK